jgi:hypothetical protein
MLADPEEEPASPRDADEVRALNAELIEDRHGIGDPQRHRVRPRVVRRLASSVATVIDVHQPELLGQLPERLRDRRAPHQVDRVQESAEDQYRCAFAAIVLEVHPAPVNRVPGVRHHAPSVGRPVGRPRRSRRRQPAAGRSGRHRGNRDGAHRSGRRSRCGGVHRPFDEVREAPRKAGDASDVARGGVLDRRRPCSLGQPAFLVGIDDPVVPRDRIP